MNTITSSTPASSAIARPGAGRRAPSSRRRGGSGSTRRWMPPRRACTGRRGRPRRSIIGSRPSCPIRAARCRSRGAISARRRRRCRRTPPRPRGSAAVRDVARRRHEPGAVARAGTSTAGLGVDVVREREAEPEVTPRPAAEVARPEQVDRRRLDRGRRRVHRARTDGRRGSRRRRRRGARRAAGGKSSAPSAARDRRSASAVTMSVPGARPMPRSTRRGEQRLEHAEGLGRPSTGCGWAA